MPFYEYPDYNLTIESESKEEADKSLQAEIENGNVSTPIEVENKEEADTQPETTENTSSPDENRTTNEDQVKAEDNTSTPKRIR